MLGDLGKFIVAKGFKKLPKVQKIARSGHTAFNLALTNLASMLLVLHFAVYLKLCSKVL